MPCTYLWKQLLAIFSLGLASIGCKAQDSAKIHNYLYVELGGAGGVGSINYERKVLAHKNIALNLRIGISTYHLKDYTNKINPDIILPLGLQSYYGRKHRLLIGTGITMAGIVQAHEGSKKPSRIPSAHAYGSIGYLYNKGKKGIIIGVNYTPILFFFKYPQHWGGLKFGYGF